MNQPTKTIAQFVRILLITHAFAALSGLPLQAHAWGADGHRLIAALAERQLSEPARREATRLLSLEPGATLASIATWADETRSPKTAPWHYVNFPRDAGCRYEPDRSCVQGACVVSAIERQVALLASEAPDDVRLQALKFVVHFVGDVHQPLHGGYADDKGGNTYQVQFAGRGSNLHALWDSGLIQQWKGGTLALREAIEREAHVAADPSGPAQWAEQSCRIVADDDFYPSRHKIDEGYGRQWNPVLVQRMAAAARRLSVLLNQALDRSWPSDPLRAR